MTNTLAKEIPENKWDIQLIEELGSLRKLFIHIIRVRNIYRDGLSTGIVEFPGDLPSSNGNVIEQLDRSMNELAFAFTQANNQRIKMGEEYLSIVELLNTAVQHEGIHQGQYFVALKQAKIKLPKRWIQDWGM
ncbi:putative damage-inducible protein DinB [Geomicrobium halophilum]|uniref:Putative damage-inducible protein DinB n=1 Tax=Geomicrobium halophilum TaxID=549000 RepID=A0A841Q0T4_9BACL|nr:DinB family protein [Geomicrobium halophilum]MBB6450995.1 putative damage-inducible protein DinB [Geomicrobium halophilum]